MSKFETFLKPFKADSLWNSKPINPQLGTYVIPPCFNPRGSTNKSFPAVGGGAFSTGIFRALPSDPAVTVYKADGKSGIFDTDTLEQRASITIPHWSADAIGASGNDGHCDIIDEEAGIIHSFWVLKKNAAGQFTAWQYSWSPLGGTGFGDPTHFSQGARATGVATCAGMIRKHEVADGKPLFEHALACSLDFTGLSNNPAFIPPATMSDWDFQYNTGGIPEGALIMLPASYDTNRLNAWPLAKKVAETLKVFGARVVDRNEFTPFFIYVENGANWKMSQAVGWDNGLANEFEYIRTQLRQVVAQDGFVAGQEDAAEPTDSVLSLRGVWSCNGKSYSLYDSLAQGINIPAVSTKTWYMNSTGLGFRLPAFTPKAGEYYKLTFNSTNNSYLRMVVHGYNASGGRAPDITVAPPGQGQWAYVKWPAGGWQELTAVAVPGNPAGVLTVSMEKVTEAEYIAATKV